ncbi:MAG TPA: YraN family protein [Spirochaetota bacterium]|nr:YraN family protein [Spirochaetota bacterium]
MEDRNLRQIGSGGEDLAASFLEARGFDILERNYRFGKAGEVDLIARRGDLVVFVEVKSRNTSVYGGPLYAINERKKRTLRLVASHYLAARSALDARTITFRFDMIAVCGGAIEWIEDILR